jgi:tRNA A-37 threonylcarbamoyl transferase component Bud32
MKDYIRLCPVCGSVSAPEDTQCGHCGTLLLGVDLTLKAVSANTATAPAPATAPQPATTVNCPHADCGMSNPPDNATCLYCGRLLTVAVPPAPTFYTLPTALAEKFRIVKVLPAGGAEAEIMILEGLTSQVNVVAKLYRPGIVPKTEVLERVNRAGFAHVVRLIAFGISDGIGYEVMEYCPAGSLRRLMTESKADPLPRDVLRQIVEEIAAALAALHAIDIIHRDLKPENVLVRRRVPLDLVLTDFGIASVNEATQRFTSLARSIKYGAPEALAGVLDQAADYWSLGLIVVELLTGHHPFDGLSDAVVTHQLVTRTINLTAIDDPQWRMLCRGLLLRDPQQRWGAADIRRWLAGDATLAEPQEATGTLPQHAARPYRIEDVVCQTPVALAAALALHWDAGRKDLMRGPLSAWVGQELQDDNLLRFIHDLIERRDISDDLRLLRLIRHLAPDMPAIWRGQSLAQPHLLAQATRAVAGDGSAAEWLVSIFGQKVLRELPASHYPSEAALVARWETGYENFGARWRHAEHELAAARRTHSSRNGVVDFDAVVFGQPVDLAPPVPIKLLPALLLVLADEAQAHVLRARVHAAAVPWLADNPWLEILLADSDPLAWLVADALAPHARRIAEDVQQRLQHAAAAETAQQNSLVMQTNQSLARLRDACDLGWLAGALERAGCAAAAQSLLALLEEARREGLPDAAPLLRTLQRAEPVALRIQEQLDAWEHAARINAAWRNRNLMQGSVGLLFFVVFLAAEFLPPRLLFFVPLVLGLVISWRVWGIHTIRSQLRNLGKALPHRVPVAPPAMST